MNQEA